MHDIQLSSLQFPSMLVLTAFLYGCTTPKAEQETDVVTNTPKASSSPGSPVASPKAKSNLGDKLEFGKPTLKDMGADIGMSQILVEVKNKGTDGLTCTLTGTFKKGDTLLGTANGAVNNIPGGGTKTVQLISTDKLDGFETVKLETSACFPTSTGNGKGSPTGRAGDPLKFGKPTVKKMMAGMSQVLVEATNTQDKQITCTVTATFKKKDEIINTANGAVNAIQPGATKTAQLVVTGEVGDYDNLIIEGSACF